MKGQALTFGYPLAARIAGSLCKLLEAGDAKAFMQLGDAHVHAVRVIVRDNIKDNSNFVAARLADELEARVNEALAALPK